MNLLPPEYKEKLYRRHIIKKMAAIEAAIFASIVLIVVAIKCTTGMLERNAAQIIRNIGEEPYRSATELSMQLKDARSEIRLTEETLAILHGEGNKDTGDIVTALYQSLPEGIVLSELEINEKVISVTVRADYHDGDRVSDYMVKLGEGGLSGTFLAAIRDERADGLNEYVLQINR